MGRRTALLLSAGAAALLAAVAYASLSLLNASYWSANATLPPVAKDLNGSLFPLARAYWYASNGYNVTVYVEKFVPGWPEVYETGVFAPKAGSGWSARLVKLAQTGSAAYSISLGGSVQISQTQTAGPYVAVPAPLTWYMTAGQPYSVLAAAWFNKGGIYALQLVNFTAKPMSKLYQQTFSCGYGLSFTTQPPWVVFYTSGGSKAYIGSTPTKLGSVTSLVLDGKNGYAAAFINVSKWIGPVPASWNFTAWWALKSALTGYDYAQLNFFIDTTGDGRPDLEVVYYISVNGRSPVLLAKTIYGLNLPNVTLLYSSQQPPSLTWLKWSVSPVWTTGYIVGMALVIYSPNGETTGYFANITLAPSTCPLPSGWYSQGSVQVGQGYLLLSGSSAAYMPLVQGALTYIANFTGSGTYAVFAQSLTPIFGISISGSAFSAICGGFTAGLGSYPNAAWVELRPLNGFGDIIVRDQYGNILARYGCYFSGSPAYVGFSTKSTLRVYNVTALG